MGFGPIYHICGLDFALRAGPRQKGPTNPCQVLCALSNGRWKQKVWACRYKQWFLKRLPIVVSGKALNSFGGWVINFGGLLKKKFTCYIKHLKIFYQKFFVSKIFHVWKYLNSKQMKHNIIVIWMSSCRVLVQGLLDFLRFHLHLFQLKNII